MSLFYNTKTVICQKVVEIFVYVLSTLADPLFPHLHFFHYVLQAEGGCSHVPFWPRIGPFSPTLCPHGPKSWKPRDFRNLQTIEMPVAKPSIWGRVMLFHDGSTFLDFRVTNRTYVCKMWTGSPMKAVKQHRTFVEQNRTTWLSLKNRAQLKGMPYNSPSKTKHSSN